MYLDLIDTCKNILDCFLSIIVLFMPASLHRGSIAPFITQVVASMLFVILIFLHYLGCALEALHLIRESVDSLCRDGADTPMPPYIG